MEDLVVPSGLYYCHPITKHKVFNHKVSKQGKTDKKSKSHDSNDESGDNIDEDDVIDESLYDKLLELVSPESRRKYDKKTRKVRAVATTVLHKIKIGKNDDAYAAGDNAKIKKQNKKTKKVRFAE